MINENITIVINTFKSEDKIFNCLESINSFCKVIIIENSNNINFKKKIEEKYPFTDCYLTGENLGYANGNNLGLSKVKSKYALILNPDTTLESETLSNFLKTANRVKDFAMIGPAKQDEYKNDDLNSEKEDVYQVNFIKGFAMFLNLYQFKDIGFFDSNFFIYLEEIDLCKRLKEKNRKIYLDKKIKINHIGGSSHNKSINFEMELSRNWHWMWSTFYFNKKHYGYLISLIKVSNKFFSSLIKMIFFLLILKKNKSKIYFQRFSGLLNSIIGKKSWYRPKIIIN
tara:strand:+ start:386 stop:1237 length:852 start_codon:yes stop_codon:yes gene_type:complete